MASCSLGTLWTGCMPSINYDRCITTIVMIECTDFYKPTVTSLQLVVAIANSRDACASLHVCCVVNTVALRCSCTASVH